MNDLDNLLKWRDQQIAVRAKFTPIIAQLNDECNKIATENFQQFKCNNFKKITGLEIDLPTFIMKGQINWEIFRNLLPQRLQHNMNAQHDLQNPEANHLQEPADVEALGVNPEETA